MRISPKYDLSKASWHKSSYSGGDGGNCLEIARWQKSSYSGGEGGDCLEVARWRTSTHSDGSGGNCLEVADDFPGIVRSGTRSPPRTARRSCSERRRGRRSSPG